MNDLTFGATLLAFFAALIAAAILEGTSPATSGTASAVRMNLAPVHVAKAAAADRAIAAQARSEVR